jgi:serine/threonine protein kinase
MAEMAENIPEETSAAEPVEALSPAPGDDTSEETAPEEATSEAVAPEKIEDKPQPEEEVAPDTGPRQPLTCTATLNDQYLIDGAEPLPHLDSPHALAYAVSDKENPGADVFALVCEPGVPARVDTIRKHRVSRFKGTIPLYDWGYIFWEPAKTSVAVIIFEKPQGGKVSELIESGKARIGEYDIVQRVLTPIATAILHLSDAEIPHRAIRPDNLYFMDADMTDLVLGECVTTPPGYDQPPIFEGIERSMTPSYGRGLGDSTDDYYALGVTIVMILIGYNPMEKYSILDILATKIEKGSYAAVCGNARLPISVIEVLRGLLSDENEARWGPDQIDAWTNGRKQSPTQRQVEAKASAAYLFDKHSHISPRTLAYAFAANYEEAFRTLKSDENFEIWLRRSLEDEDMADIYAGLMEHAVSMAGTPTAEPDVVISRICMLLDPNGPIRYRKMAFMPDSLGTVIAIKSMVEKNTETITDIIKGEIYDFWFKAQLHNTSTIIDWQRTFVRSRGYLMIPDLGYGIERCLYEMNENVPCQSPLIIDECVVDSEDLLGALDGVSNKVESGSHPIDRHIAAFIAARFVEDVHLHLKAVSAPAPDRTALGTLSLLAYLQYVHRGKPVLGLASWVGSLLGPVINTYHNRTTRRELEKEIPQLVRKGSLPELFDLLENAERRNTDNSGFTESQARFVSCENEIIEVIGVEGEREAKILASGRKVTAMISILLSMTIVTMLFILNVL